MLPYYEDKKILLCPAATKPIWEVYFEVDGPGMYTPKYAGWGYADDKVYGPDFEDTCITYGLNEWICNYSSPPPPHAPQEEEKFWRTPDVKGASNVPMLLDCVWPGGWPQQTDDPPPREENITIWEMVASGHDMMRFCIDRHDNGTINGSFLDFSVREIGLKELWKLKWHRNFDINADPPVWPHWMRRFKEYD